MNYRVKHTSDRFGANEVLVAETDGLREALEVVQAQSGVGHITVYEVRSTGPYAIGYAVTKDCGCVQWESSRLVALHCLDHNSGLCAVCMKPIQNLDDEGVSMSVGLVHDGGCYRFAQAQEERGLVERNREQETAVRSVE